MRTLVLILALLVTVPAWAGVDYNGDADQHNCGDITTFDGASSMWCVFVVDVDAVGGDFISKDSAYEVYMDTDDFGACISTGGGTRCHASTSSALTAGAGYQTLLFNWKGGNDMDFYVDGADAGETVAWDGGGATLTTINNSGNNLYIASYDGASNYGNGQYYHIACGTGTLTTQQIAELSLSNIKDAPEQVGALFDLWMDDYAAGSAVASSTLLDRAGGVTCSGTDADADSSFIAEPEAVYP